MTITIKGATLIDGTGAEPVSNATVVVDGERIERVGAGIEPARDSDVIDAAGLTLMPGLIDCHVHLLFHPASLQERLLTPPTLQIFYGAANAVATLDAGVTSVRDAGGTPQGFKMAIDRGLIPGPRMKIAVAILSQSGGHGDATMPSGVRTRVPWGPEFPNNVVDGPDEIRKAVRELLRAGADFIKLCSTGGVLSPADEPGHTQFSPEEIAVMVAEARAAGKTCMAHAQGNEGIKNAVTAGVESIEHGIYLDDDVIDDMKRRGTFLVPTLVAPMWVLRNAEQRPGSVLPQSLRKSQEVMEHHRASFTHAVNVRRAHRHGHRQRRRSAWLQRRGAGAHGGWRHDADGGHRRQHEDGQRVHPRVARDRHDRAGQARGPSPHRWRSRSRTSRYSRTRRGSR